MYIAGDWDALAGLFQDWCYSFGMHELFIYLHINSSHFKIYASLLYCVIKKVKYIQESIY